MCERYPTLRRFEDTWPIRKALQQFLMHAKDRIKTPRGGKRRVADAKDDEDDGTWDIGSDVDVADVDVGRPRAPGRGGAAYEDEDKTDEDNNEAENTEEDDEPAGAFWKADKAAAKQRRKDMLKEAAAKQHNKSNTTSNTSSKGKLLKKGEVKLCVLGSSC